MKDTPTLRIVFFGTPEFAVASLRRLRAAGHRIVGVVTMPDRPGDRRRPLIESDVKKYALAEGLPLFQPERLKDPAFLADLEALRADLFVVIAFRMLPEQVWQMPPLGTINLHASLLPKYRGAAPINRAVMAGERQTGVSTFLLKHEIDTGDILLQEAIDIGPDENAGSVHDRLMALGARLTHETVGRLAAGNITPIPQERFIYSTPCPAPKIFRADCRIDWHKSGAAIHNHVRGLAPYPGAWSGLTLAGPGGEESETLKILATSTATHGAPALRPGELLATGGKVLAGTADGVIALLTVQPAGKRAMDADAWFRGLHAGENNRIPALV